MIQEFIKESMGTDIRAFCGWRTRCGEKHETPEFGRLGFPEQLA